MVSITEDREETDCFLSIPLVIALSSKLFLKRVDIHHIF